MNEIDSVTINSEVDFEKSVNDIFIDDIEDDLTPYIKVLKQSINNMLCQRFE
jgi:hypothetical protein